MRRWLASRAATDQAEAEAMRERYRERYRAKYPDLATAAKRFETKMIVDESNHFDDAMGYMVAGQVASRLHRQGVAREPIKSMGWDVNPSKIWYQEPEAPTLATYSDADLIMEMIKRGYAAMKLPEGGGPPEVLR